MTFNNIIEITHLLDHKIIVGFFHSNKMCFGYSFVLFLVNAFNLNKKKFKSTRTA